MYWEKYAINGLIQKEEKCINIYRSIKPII